MNRELRPVFGLICSRRLLLIDELNWDIIESRLDGLFVNILTWQQIFGEHLEPWISCESILGDFLDILLYFAHCLELICWCCCWWWHRNFGLRYWPITVLLQLECACVIADSSWFPPLVLIFDWSTLQGEHRAIIVETIGCLPTLMGSADCTRHWSLLIRWS